MSFDATALFPSVPIREALGHILELLEADNTLHTRTKLTPYDIIDLADICLSTSDFVYDERHHTTEQSGPIGLSLMVTVSVIWMDNTMKTAVKTAKARHIPVPRLIFTYVDDCLTTIYDPPRRTGLRSNDTPIDPTIAFNDCLNSVHPRVQFTREEEENRSIAFLDVLVTREEDGRMTHTIYRKPSNTNVGLKPQSCQDPKTAIAAFKGELCRCHRLCSTTEQRKNAIKFAIQMFVDNGHDRLTLQNVANTYTPPTDQQRKERIEKQKNNKKSASPSNAEKENSNLFQELPFPELQPEKNEEDKAYVCVPFIPEIGPQLKRILKKNNINTAFKSAPKLKDILCSRNKTHPDPDKKKGIYKYTCPCSEKSTYIGQTNRSFKLRWDEHAKAIEGKSWQHSGITQHYENCTHPFNKDHFQPIHNMQGKKRLKLAYDTRVREAMEI